MMVQKLRITAAACCLCVDFYVQSNETYQTDIKPSIVSRIDFLIGVFLISYLFVVAAAASGGGERRILFFPPPIT